jgi:hypothetical protein
VERERWVSAYSVLAESSAIYLDASALPKIDIEEDLVSGLTRCLIYFSHIPTFCSMVGFGEFVGAAGRKEKEGKIASDGYLYSCRALLVDVEMGKLQMVEPPADRFEFITAARPLVAKYSHLGGGDIWHLLCAAQLSAQHPPATFLSFDKKLCSAATAEGLRVVYGHDLQRELLIAELRAKGKWSGG